MLNRVVTARVVHGVLGRVALDVVLRALGRRRRVGDEMLQTAHVLWTAFQAGFTRAGRGLRRESGSATCHARCPKAESR